MISYAGVDLSLWTPKAATWAERHIPLDRIFPPRNDWTPPTDRGIPWPAPWSPPPVKVNVYTCPIGLSRWGTFYGLVDQTQLAAIRANIAANGGPGAPIETLSLSDHRPASRLRVRMLMLDPIPLSGIAGEMSLLTLVDPRYTFAHALTISQGMDGKTRTWYDLIRGAFLDSTVSASPAPPTDYYILDYNGNGSGLIPDAYGKPTTKWNFGNRVPKGPLLDAIANSLQMRWLFIPYQPTFSLSDSMQGRLVLTGSGKIGSLGTVTTEHTYNFPGETDSVCVVNPPAETVITDSAQNYWGWNTFESDAGRHNLLCDREAGTREDAGDLKRAVPARVRIGSVSTLSLVTLASVGGAGGYAGELAGGGTLYHESPTIYIDRPLLTAAEEKVIAGDYYGWMRADADVTWPGVVRPKFSGLCWGIEWSPTQTRYIRHPRTDAARGKNASELNDRGLFDRPEIILVTGAGLDADLAWYTCSRIGVVQSVPSPVPAPYPVPLWVQGTTGFVRPMQDPMVVGPVPPGAADAPAHLEIGEKYVAFRLKPRADGSMQWVAFEKLSRVVRMPIIPADGTFLVQGAGTGGDPYRIVIPNYAGFYRIPYTDSTLP